MDISKRAITPISVSRFSTLRNIVGKGRKVRGTIGAIIFLLQACAKPIAPEQPPPIPEPMEYPQNIILMIGDGMGLSAISAAMYSNKARLNLDRFPKIGLHKPYSFDDLITDSAAGATAFACGVKTYNNAIGVNSDTISCQTILEEAVKRKKATGMVVTSSIVHATPAAFMAHQPLRVLYEAIAEDFMQTDVDLLIGGGERYFDNRDSDNRNLVAEWRKKGYQVWSYNQVSLASLKFDPAFKTVYFTADNHPPYWSMGRNYLPLATEKALKFLSERNKDGFFLMIEGSQIDWAAHNNQGKELISETLDFDQAIGIVLDFAQRRGDTLVIVTADHESGGVAINNDSSMGKIKPVFTSNGHTGALIPVFAYGPQASLFTGIYENTAINGKMRAAFGFPKDKAQ